MTVLLDSNVLIAVAIDAHVHHTAARRWLADSPLSFATCSVTQGALIRQVVRGDDTIDTAVEIVRRISNHTRHEFWAGELSYLDVRWKGVIGHRQVTDAYLAELARRRDGRVATFDKGFAALHDDVAELVAVGS